MAERPEPPGPDPREEPVWAVLRRAGPAIIGVGALLIVVGIFAGQSVGVLAIDLMGLVLGVILMLVVRWR